MDEKSKKIIILGAGFGGLRAVIFVAKKIRSLGLLKRYDIILVDRNEHHTYTPLLYEAATTSKETANLAKLHSVTTHSIWSLIENLPITFVHGEVQTLDVMGGTIRLHDGHVLKYNHLIIALGSETNYFNIKGLQEYSLPLKSFKDAIKIRDAVWNLAMGGQHNIQILLGGGGSTGVELAAELISWCGELNQDFPKCRIKVKIIEAGPTILGGLSPKVIDCVRRRLHALGVEIITKAKIIEATKDRVLLENGTVVSFDLLVWAGGVKAPGILSKLPLQVEPRGRLITTNKMECLSQAQIPKLHSKIYALGDSVYLSDPKTERPIPAVARAAIEQAKIAACNILEDIKLENGLAKEPLYREYKSQDYPYITPVGGKYAVAKIGSFVIAGFFGWFLKGLIELHYLLSIMPPLRALGVWLKGLKIFIQNDRLG